MINKFKYIMFSVYALFAFFATVPMHASTNHTIDSLRAITRSNQHDTTKINAYMDLARLLYKQHPDSSINVLCNAETLAKQTLQKTDNPVVTKATKILLAKLYNNQGILYKRMGYPEKALDNYFRSLSIKESLKDSVGISTSNYNIANIYSNMTDYPNTLKYGFASLQLSEKLGDIEGVIYCNKLLATTYINHKDYEHALDYCNRNIKLCTENENSYMLANTYIDCSIISTKTGEYDKALAYSQLALQYLDEGEYNEDIIQVNISMALTYSDMGNEQEALRVLNVALKLAEDINYQKGLSNIYYSLGNIAIKQNKIHDAKVFAEKSYNISKKLGYPNELCDAASLQKTVFEKMGDYKKAYRYLQEEIALKDSISNDQNYMEIQTKQAQYQYEKQSVIDSLTFQKQLEVKDVQMKKRGLVRNTFIAFSLLSSFFLIFLIRSNLQKKKAHVLLAEKTNKINEQKEELQKHKNNLEELVEKRTEQLEIANKKLEHLDQSKSYFLGLLAHELSTPLNGIIGGAQFIVSMSKDEDNVEMARLILESAYRLNRFSNISRLITNLQLGSYHLMFRKTPIYYLLQEAVCLFEAKLEVENRHISFLNELENSEIELYIDEGLISQTIEFILDNAKRYTPEEGRICLRDKVSEEHYSLLISDSGPGFSDKAIENIFTMFSSDELMNHSDGLGLSLVAAKIIMEYHDGSINIMNPERGGATVELIFPLSKFDPETED